MFCTEKSSWKVTTLSLVRVSLATCPSLTLAVSRSRGGHTCRSCSRIGSTSAPASICSSRLAARAGSIFLPMDGM